MMRRKTRERRDEGSVTIRCEPVRAGVVASSAVVLLEELGICVFLFFI